MTDQNLAFYFQDFTTTLTNGSVQYSTACVIPSNTVLNRVVGITISGTLFPQETNQYTLVLDFTKVQSGRDINLEGPIDGVVTFCKRTFDASNLLTYTFSDRILTLQMEIPQVIQKKPKHFFINIQINDDPCCKSCPVPNGLQNMDFSVKSQCALLSGSFVNAYSDGRAILLAAANGICLSLTQLSLVVKVDKAGDNFTYSISNLGTYTSGSCTYTINNEGFSQTATVTVTWPNGGTKTLTAPGLQKTTGTFSFS
jgi:hypothetical protein